jgi:hypothetical protein
MIGQAVKWLNSEMHTPSTCQNPLIGHHQRSIRGSSSTGHHRISQKNILPSWTHNQMMDTQSDTQSNDGHMIKQLMDGETSCRVVTSLGQTLKGCDFIWSNIQANSNVYRFD